MSHTIHGRHHHWRWDNSLPPALTMAPGETVVVEMMDPGGGQITPSSTVEQVARLDFGRVNPVTGPIFVDGARPGDVCRITILSLQTSGWGWSALIPGFGLLAEDFPEPHLVHWSYDKTGQRPALLGPARVPLKPLIGSIGLAFARPGAHDVLPPRRVGGTMDIRDLGPGAELLLPIEVAGGLLSIGDGHAAQGDGEVCGTAIETAMSAELRIDLIKNMELPGPQFITSGPVTRHLDDAGYEVTTGIGPSLYVGAMDAVRAMIDRLQRRHGISAADAYVLCSVCADLRVSQIVDRPNWLVSLYFPRKLFD
jgi:acetamidase/formamidase